jgi:hypothetical protein
MILSKLEEALVEVSKERQAISEVEAQLRAMISKLKGNPYAFTDELPPDYPVKGPMTFIPTTAPHGQKDRIEEIADILRSHGQALHITTIAERLSKLRNSKIVRTDIEPGLNRHIAKTKKPKVTKFGPSIYGLPEWRTQNQPTLTHIAS